MPGKDIEYIVVPEDWGYEVRGCYQTAGTFDIIAIDWLHPNTGFYTEAMLWIRSPHQSEWQLHSVVQWSTDYASFEEFIGEYPSFTPLFQTKQRPFYDDSL